jgi:hypothetical protein
MLCVKQIYELLKSLFYDDDDDAPPQHHQQQQRHPILIIMQCENLCFVPLLLLPLLVSSYVSTHAYILL